MPESNYSYNLWKQPWITVIELNGRLKRVNLRDAILNAHQYHSVYDVSPLVVAGVTRLLVAILQDIVNPQTDADIQNLYRAGTFDVIQNKITAFEQQYCEHFDLFHTKTPFMQSGDIPLDLKKSTKIKNVAMLFVELPSGTNKVHWKVSLPRKQVFCPACVATGLTTVPMFTIAYGKGNFPGINQAPPIYIFPQGKNLFQTLTLSLILPTYQPSSASVEDKVFWKNSSGVVEFCHPKKGRGDRLPYTAVSYLHGLLFLARKARAFPIQGKTICTRCGETTNVAVESIYWQQGELYSNDSGSWFDPFVSYIQKNGNNWPFPVRLKPGESLLHSFLFLAKDKDKTTVLPARVINQRYKLGVDDPDDNILTFRCIAISTDKKAKSKINEWVDAFVEIPRNINQSIVMSECLRTFVDLSSDCYGQLLKAFPAGVDEDKTKGIIAGNYWGSLTQLFHDFIKNLANSDEDDCDAVLADGLMRLGRLTNRIYSSYIKSMLYADLREQYKRESALVGFIERYVYGNK